MPKIIDSIDYSLKELLVDSMNDSADLYKEFKSQAPFNATHNCFSSARWDAINEILSKAFQKHGVPFTSTKRGFWELLLFCDLERQVLLSAMREDRFNEICGNPEEKAPRYFDSLVSLNSELEAKSSQCSLIDDEYEACDKYNQLENLCRCLPTPNGDKYHHVVLLFNVEYDEVTSIRLCVINNKFEIVEEEDILQLVLSKRSESIKINEVEESNEQNGVVQRGFIKLKKNAIETV